MRCWLAWFPLGFLYPLSVDIRLRARACVCVCCNPANYAPEMRFYSELDLFIVILCLILACGINGYLV